MATATDLKSVGRKFLEVRVLSWLPILRVSVNWQTTGLQNQHTLGSSPRTRASLRAVYGQGITR